MDILHKSPAHQSAILHALRGIPFPSDEAGRPAALLQRCPVAEETPLIPVPDLAEQLAVASVHIKDERARMGLGSFKALGAAYVIASDAEAGRAKGTAYYTASAGNHGLSVAAGAAAFGARAVIYLAQTVPQAFAERLSALGADVRWRGASYEDSMDAAAQDAEAEGGVLLSDSSWPQYLERPHRLMEGYLVLMREVVTQIPQPPTHIFLQAGVGGLACACAAFARKAWGATPRIIVVEPEVAPALQASIRVGHPVVTEGPASAMGRLDCKAPSVIALKGLARDADDFMTLSEAEGQAGAARAAALGLPSTPSGAAGLAAALVADTVLDAQSRILLILSEGPE